MRKILSIIALFAIFVSNTFGETEYYALLVGIADYQQGGDLNGADDDIRAAAADAGTVEPEGSLINTYPLNPTLQGR